MRNLLLAGVALGAVSALVAAPARAQTPAAVFPVTTETDLAGYNGPSLNGAAPGSVQVNLGGRTFSALYFQNQFKKNQPQWAAAPQPQFMYYFFLYPGFDYASPGGTHFGAQAEIRVTNSEQPSPTNSGYTVPTPFFHVAYTYVSSPVWGKVQFGTPAGALVQNAVGTSDDFGTGVFFSWYNTGVNWVMADAPDNYTPTQKVVYTTPTFGGFLAAISWQPTEVSMNYSDGLTKYQNPDCGVDGTCLALQKDRVEIAAKYAGTFGAVGFKGNVGYVYAATEKGGDALGNPATVAQDVSYGNVGLQFNFGGFELEGSANFGRFNVAINGVGNPDGPLPRGAKNSKAWVVGAGYQTGPFKVGAVYYGQDYDAADLGYTASPPGTKTGTMAGVGLGAAYTVGPGVVAYLDATTARVYATDFTGTSFGKNTPSGLGIGTFFTW